MSGFEVAGIVLGSLPLLISCLEHYAEGVRTIKSMWDYPKEFATLSRRLRVESDVFLNTLEHILSGCVDDEGLAELLRDAMSPVWAAPTVEKALRRKLGRGYATYRETITHMDETIKTFMQRLRLTSDGKVPFSDPRSFKEAYKRFKFGLKKSAYMDLIDDIKRDNAALDKLTEQSVMLEPVRLSRNRHPKFDKLRTHASSVFTTLQRSLNGSCVASHRASMYVQEPDWGVAGDAKVHEDDMTIRLVLHHEHAPTSLPSWSSAEAEVRQVSMAPVVSDVVAGAANPAKASKVKFASAPIVTSTNNTTAVVHWDPKIHDIQDLCASMAQLRAKQRGVCLGYLVDNYSSIRHGFFWPLAPLVDKTPIATASLGDILAEPVTSNIISVGDRRRLAAKLAFNMLRLHDTPWLAAQWGHNDVIFFKKDGQMLPRHPFIAVRLQAANTTSGTLPAYGTYFDSCPAVANETIFALGVLLIELCLLMPFQKLLSSAELNIDGSKKPFAEYLAAIRLLPQVDDTAGRRYGDAVRRCILGNFDQRDTRLTDAAFRRAVYDGVVAVLQEDLDEFLGRTKLY